MLLLTQQMELLQIAKSAILNKFNNIEYKLIQPKDEKLVQQKATFVTLKHNKKELRGCVGTIIPINPLYIDVWKNSKSAAFDDTRFNSLDLDEIKNDLNFTVEISILTLPELIKFDNINDLLIYLNKYKPGLIIKKGYYQATFLPDVWDQLSDANQFITHLVYKSGYSPELFRSDNMLDWEIKTYSTEKFEQIWNKIYL